METTYYTDPEAAICRNCRFYMAHYVYLPRERRLNPYVMTECGHCMEPRIKPRRPGDSCQRFERR